MRVAVLSGKGGTGKTMLAVNLAALEESGLYLDCDVEEPDGHLFFRPERPSVTPVEVPVPVVDTALCDGCQECVGFCRYHALAWTGKKVLVFPEICHSCGGCALVCPRKAIREEKRAVGQLEEGLSGNTRVISGILSPGEASGTPVIQALLARVAGKRDLIMDGPPGTGCMVAETLRAADYCLLVAEPTRYGAHNLEMVHQLVRAWNRPCGVVLNKVDSGDNPSLAYARSAGLAVLGAIPFDLELTRLGAAGEIAVHRNETFRQTLLTIRGNMEKGVNS